jgi:hypothetical protein
MSIYAHLFRGLDKEAAERPDRGKTDLEGERPSLGNGVPG